MSPKISARSLASLYAFLGWATAASAGSMPPRPDGEPLLLGHRHLPLRPVGRDEGQDDRVERVRPQDEPAGPHPFAAPERAAAPFEEDDMRQAANALRSDLHARRVLPLAVEVLHPHLDAAPKPEVVAA